jgi:hypothetical protein
MLCTLPRIPLLKLYEQRFVIQPDGYRLGEKIR